MYSVRPASRSKLHLVTITWSFTARQASTSKSQYSFISLSQVLGHCDNDRSASPCPSRPHPSTGILDCGANPYLALSTLSFFSTSHQNCRPMKKCHCPSLARIPKFSPLRCLRSFKTRLVPCDIRGCLSLERSPSTYFNLIWFSYTITSQGGFARVYQVRDSRNTYLACKAVTKSSLKTKKAKIKVRVHCV